MICTSDPIGASGPSPHQPASVRAPESRASAHPPRVQRQLAGRIRDELARDGHGELVRVSINCDGHWVELSGKVSSFYLKQRAQEAVRRVAPGRQVFNEVQVVVSGARRGR